MVSHTNTNGRHLIAGRWMLLSDQDVTFTRHHITDQFVSSFVLVGLAGLMQELPIEPWMRVCMVAAAIIMLRTLCVVATNLVMGLGQLYPRCSFTYWLRFPAIRLALVAALAIAL